MPHSEERGLLLIAQGVLSDGRDLWRRSDTLETEVWRLEMADDDPTRVDFADGTMEAIEESDWLTARRWFRDQTPVEEDGLH